MFAVFLPIRFIRMLLSEEKLNIESSSPFSCYIYSFSVIVGNPVKRRAAANLIMNRSSIHSRNFKTLFCTHKQKFHRPLFRI
ncbi:hypothetical protein EG68_10854 [Paragonimus skrjabini miyazakii]|uniref:Uncharacterized protein n=1 Tax=Paragonimus skrjabini miyazakii TaxID=59628 RepID=A0A8S9YQI6_9TREM|nr:hypothetical protein EG68_10854 [Paragonimus skrjabini miyazakii]